MKKLYEIPEIDYTLVVDASDILTDSLNGGPGVDMGEVGDIETKAQ